MLKSSAVGAAEAAGGAVQAGGRDSVAYKRLCSSRVAAWACPLFW